MISGLHVYFEGHAFGPRAMSTFGPIGHFEDRFGSEADIPDCPCPKSALLLAADISRRGQDIRYGP